MFRKPIACLLAALCCLAGLAVTASAAEVESGSVYCFSAGDFSEEEDFAGICITSLPENGHTMLGSRVLREGDVLTGAQAAQMTFCPVDTETDTAVTMGYLPVFSGHVGDAAVMTLSIRGREDKAPVAEDSALETYKNLETKGKLKVSDPEGKQMTFTVTRLPKRGTVVIAGDGSFTYTPKKNKVGIDSFTYTAADPAGKTSREATVTITILKPTDSAQYTDTIGKECRFAAEWMRNTGIFVGESVASNACFSPEKTVTRGEFVTMLVKAMEIPVDEALTYTGYEDEIPLWLQPYLAAAVRAGLTAGLEGRQTFGAALPITGEEAAAMLKTAMDQEITVEGELLTRAEAAQVLYECVRLLGEDKKLA